MDNLTLSLQIDAIDFIPHRTTALRKTAPLAPEFVTLYVTAFWVQVTSMPAQADGDERYDWYQAGLIFLLKNCFQLQHKNAHKLRHPKWQKSGKCWVLPSLETSATNILVKSQWVTCMYSSKNVFGSNLLLPDLLWRKSVFLH